MPSTTRGSILISTANDIGEALVEKLGGVGYSPNEWKEKYNLCGIAPVDSAPALSVLADSAGTGDERGSILIATADAIGAILNKKYNVLRGFKPKEWASACRKMKALEEGSVASASIASFSDGADTVSLTSCVCNIDENLDGKSAVVCTKTGKNLVDDNMYQDGNNRVILAENVYLKSGTYTISLDIETPRNFYYKPHGSGSWTNIGGYNKKIVTFTISEDDNYDFSYYVSTGILVSEISNLMLEVGSSATTFEPYKTPETKTADLGRAVYGGQADIIKGVCDPLNWLDVTAREEVTRNNVVSSISSDGTITASGQSTGNGDIPVALGTSINLVGGQTYIFSIIGTDTRSGSVYVYFSGGSYISINNSNHSGTYTPSADQTITGITLRMFNGQSITLEAKIQLEKGSTAGNYSPYFEPFTFEPVKIDSFPGVNNIWNDCGNTAVEYYKAPTPYARKTATGGIANFSDQRTDLPLTKAIANIAPSIAGKSAVNLYQGSEQYQAPTTYTAELGETVYGGSVDFVSGEVQETYGMKVFDGTEGTGGTPSWTMISVTQGTMFRITISDKATTSTTNTLCNYYTPVTQAQRADGTVSGAGTNVDIIDNRFSSVDAFKAWLEENPVTLVYELATPTENTIPGRVISPIEGVNNYWNDAGGDTEIQYFENET